jgi:hypothetical protein
MISVVLGWILVVLGVLSYLSGLAAFFKGQFFTPAEKTETRGLGSAELEAVAEVLDKLATAFEQFGKLSVPVQWALLGIATFGVGAYLIAAQPL